MRSILELADREEVPFRIAETMVLEIKETSNTVRSRCEKLSVFRNILEFVDRDTV